MPDMMRNFKKISKALYSSNEILQKESMPDTARKQLEEAEQSLNKAIYYVLSTKRNRGVN